MTDVIERLKELCSNQIADPSTAPEFVFLDPDLPVSEWEKQYSMDVVYVRADRIEELVAELDLMKTAGIIEIASRNNRVTEYMFHWEGRALDAEAKLAKAVEALKSLHHAVCGETGFASAVRNHSGKAYPWEALDIADAQTRTVLAELEGEKK